MLIGLYNDLACHWKHWVYFTCVMSLCVQSWFLEREEQKSAFPMGAAFEAWYQMKLHTLQRDPDMPCWQTPSINVDKMHAFIHQSAREKCTILLLMSYFKKYHWRLYIYNSSESSFQFGLMRRLHVIFHKKLFFMKPGQCKCVYICTCPHLIKLIVTSF